MTGDSGNPSVFDEPHMRGNDFEPDPSEASAARNIERARRQKEGTDELVERSVWSEPGLSSELAGGAGKSGLAYGEWLDARLRETSFAKSWLVTLAVAAGAGPWAIFAAFLGSGQTVFSIMAIVLFGPLVEELGKVAIALYVVEKRPFYFRSAGQILFCALAGGLIFASLENLIYLHIYVPDPSLGLARWRWSVCAALHTGCSGVAGLGLVHVWRDAWERRARGRTTLAYPYLVTAVAIHGTYNAFATTLMLTGFDF